MVVQQQQLQQQQRAMSVHHTRLLDKYPECVWQTPDFNMSMQGGMIALTGQGR